MDRERLYTLCLSYEEKIHCIACRPNQTENHWLNNEEVRMGISERVLGLVSGISTQEYHLMKHWRTLP